MRSDAGQAPVQSVDRALTILEAVAVAGEAGVGELALRLGVHKSTASRLLGVLEAHRLVEQVGERGRYRLAAGLLRLAAAVPSRTDLTVAARPVCERLAALAGETVNVAVLADGAAVNIVDVPGPSAVAARSFLGQRMPVHATSSGKVLAAFTDGALPAARELERFTALTITDPAAFAAELAEVRRNGTGRSVEEWELGMAAIAAPVRDRTGDVIAALSVTGPSYRLTAAELDRLTQTVTAAAEEFSAALGAPPAVTGRGPDVDAPGLPTKDVPTGPSA